MSLDLPAGLRRLADALEAYDNPASVDDRLKAVGILAGNWRRIAALPAVNGPAMIERDTLALCADQLEDALRGVAPDVPAPAVHLINEAGQVGCCGAALAALPMGDEVTTDPRQVTCAGTDSPARSEGGPGPRRTRRPDER